MNELELKIEEIIKENAQRRMTLGEMIEFFSMQGYTKEDVIKSINRVMNAHKHTNPNELT